MEEMLWVNNDSANGLLPDDIRSLAERIVA